MNTTRRRSIRTLASLGIVSLVAGCGLFTSKTTNGVTTVTVNTAQLNTDGAALITAVQAVLMNPAIAVALGPKLLIAQTILISAKATMASIATATNGVATASINTTSVQNFVVSLIADIQQIVTIVNAVIPLLAGAVASQIGGYLSAVSALIPFVQLAVALATPASATMGVHMSEAEALHVATH